MMQFWPIYRESSGYDGPDLRYFEVTNATHKNIKNNIKRRKRCKQLRTSF